MKPLHKTTWIVLFALAMGFLESAVVVYLRALYYPEGFDFPLQAMSQTLAITELYREAATLIMLVAMGVLAAKHNLHRFAWFLLVFAVWDISYYIFLKLLINWPASLLTPDILFLLPGMWTGPVLAPVINSLIMILLAYAILAGRNKSMLVTGLSRSIWTLLIAGTLIIIANYMADYASYVIENKSAIASTKVSWNEFMIIQSTQFIPRAFNWLIFSAGVAMHLAAVVLIVFGRGIQTESDDQT